MVMTVGHSHQWNVNLVIRSFIAFSLLIFLGSQLAVAGTAFAAVKPADATLPRELGTIEKRVEGAAGQPLIFIVGEEHVSLRVQETVADILRYLTGAYDVQLVCTEGYDKPVNVAHGISITVVRRFVASADLAARRISGVEYFAIANPEVDVVGVEDMKAYEAHSNLLHTQESQRIEAYQQWEDDFAKFLYEDLGAIEDTPQNEEQLSDAINKQKDFPGFAEAIYRIVGKTSSVGKKLFDLQQRRDALENEKRAADEQLMHTKEWKARDEALVANTLRTIKEKKVDSAVLVVGALHLDGVEEIFSKKQIPFVAIVAAGVQEAQKSFSAEDQRIFQEWRKGEPTGGLEYWLSHIHIKAIPSARLSYQDRTAVLGILAVADYLRLRGKSQKEILDFVRTTSLPAGVQIEEVFDIEGGVGVAFSAQGRKAYAYFGEAADRVKPPQAPEPVEIGTGGGRYYAVYTGGGGGKEPPIPPRRPPPGGPDEPRPPSTGIAAGGFLTGYKKAITDQTHERPERVTILYRRENGNLVRYVNDQPMALFAVPADVEELVKGYREASVGPEKVLRAQKLADVLLVDINAQLPDKTEEIFVISQDNLLKDISLPMLEAIAGRKDATKLNSIDLRTRSYVVNASRDKVDLSVLSKEVTDTEKAEKTKASEEIERKTIAENATIKQLLSKASSEHGLPESLERLTHSTEARS